MEAKRYDESPSLQIIAGKASIAGHALGGSIDLWVLGATCEVGDETVKSVSEMLDNRGITLLVLDWSPHSVPRLAVLLASSHSATREWWKRVQPSVSQAELEQILEAIRAHDDFTNVEDSLRRECSAPHVGVETLKLQTCRWMREHLSSRDESRRRFGQHLNILGSDTQLVDRRELRKALVEKVNECRQLVRPGLVVVLGDEGSGKSWLVVDLWATTMMECIIIFVSGRRAQIVDEVGPDNPMRALARLLAAQEDRDDEQRVGQWYRRLRNWADHGPAIEPRFLIVLDGLNEHPGAPWADLLYAYSELARKLGGLLIATCRPGFWRSKVKPVVHASLEVRELAIDGYSPQELDELLAKARVDTAQLTAPLREFLRTPRVATVALGLLDRLQLAPSELTVERLLLAYLSWPRFGGQRVKQPRPSVQS